MFIRLIGFTAAALLAGAVMADETPVAQGMNQFATAAYQELARGGENVIFSPFSIFTALSMTLSGARGETAREIGAVLHQPAAGASYHDDLAKLVEQLGHSANRNGTELLNANGLWVDSGFRVQAGFRETLERRYHAPLVPLAFAGDPEAARREINRWTGQQTKGKIAELFAPGSLDRRTRLVITTAIYFNGKWQSAFRPQDTRPGPFRLTSGRTAEASFMNQSAKFGYAENASIQILEMKYGDGALAFDVILPKSTDGLNEVERSLTSETLSGWFRELQTRTVEVALPKFRAESEFSLQGTLSKMGMPSAFHETANFSGIDDRRDLFLSQVRHKAFVDVSEEGTEAAAATGVGVSVTSMIVTPKPIFRADHPFAFFIRDTRSGVLLFAGRLLHPER